MKKSGFTLIELMVVISIISLLSGIVLASISQARSKARDTKRILDVRQIKNALAMYYQENGSYPVPGGVQDPAEFYDNCTSVTAFAEALKPVTDAKFISSLPTTSSDPNLCFTYAPGQNISFDANTKDILGGEHISAFNPSCGGKIITSKDYVILFDLENKNNNLAKYSDPEGTAAEKQYCISP